MKDPIVEEVRQIRIKIEQDCEQSGTSYKDHLLSVQKEYESRLVMPPNGCAERKSGTV